MLGPPLFDTCPYGKVSKPGAFANGGCRVELLHVFVASVCVKALVLPEVLNDLWLPYTTIAHQRAPTHTTMPENTDYDTEQTDG